MNVLRAMRPASYHGFVSKDMAKPRRIGFIGFDGVIALDLTGPMETFALTPEVQPAGADPYELVLLGLTAGAFRSSSGLTMVPDCSLDRAPRLDTVIVPGGRGLREPAVHNRIAAWLRRHAPRCRRVASVCTGIYGLAPSGLLDGRRVTTHWRFAADVAQRFPALRVEPDALYVRDGSFYTSAGVTAGIDLALALIEEDHGAKVALTVAREMVLYLRRPGGQEQYSEPLRFQTESADHFSDLAAWMLANLQRDLSIEVLAKRVHLSPRHFQRQFTKSFGRPAASLVEDLRLDEARRRLARPGVAVAAAAAGAGFRSADSFCRAFKRRYGIAPSTYAARFALPRDHGRQRAPEHRRTS